MEGLNIVDADMKVFIHPSQINNLSEAIPRELSNLLFKYSDSFDGVLLAYNVNVPEKKGRILPSVHPFISVKLSAKLLVFMPKPNMLLEGKVMKVNEESIHVVVLGFSSAVIIDEDIRKEFKYVMKHGEGLFVNRNDKRHAIKVGTMIRFLVKSLNEETMHIYGSLIPAHTGSIKRLEKQSSDYKSNTESLANNSSLKKRKDQQQDTETTEHGNVVKDAHHQPNDGHGNKKPKKVKLEA
ncbi:Probable DNA-directed RNA polymerase I subunit RPA43 [Linum perenne]